MPQEESQTSKVPLADPPTYLRWTESQIETIPPKLQHHCPWVPAPWRWWENNGSESRFTFRTRHILTYSGLFFCRNPSYTSWIQKKWDEENTDLTQAQMKRVRYDRRWNENPAAQYFWSRSSDTDPRYQRGIHSDTWYTLIHYINIETNKTDLLNFTAFINTFNADWFDVRVKGPIFLCTILFCFVHQRWHRRTFGISPQLNVSSTPPNIEHPPQFYGSKHVLCSPIRERD